MKVHVGQADEIRAEGHIVVAIGEKEVGLFAVGDGIVGWMNICPHQGGPVCQGRLFRRVVEPLDAERRSFGRQFDETDRHIVCPWHGLEFDLRTGRNAANGELRLRGVPVTVEGEDVYVEV
ncbi:Rieske 2Fe-2S domain-containing protein [Pseudoruegeria sp. HB172150]|uniref:Rieske (2Fe-2S) protein n=1 Tax=Pseudoruegeria sp. HB172150 TaxID=2721164 RepID=UPI001553FE78|nr:Rieske 2Fe-2S domain-containing protein [Pseudoruegeria sp. HB172150]